MITIKNLVCERLSLPLFSPISLELKAGEALQISGPNGSGKSTLLRTLAGFRKPILGEFKIDRPVAYLGHRNDLMEAQTVRDNLVWTTKMHLGNICIKNVIEKFQLRAFEDTHIQELSAGQKRRVGLANLYCKNRLLWILDEPTSGFDSDRKMWFDILINEELKKGKVVVFTTHQSHQIPGLKKVEL